MSHVYAEQNTLSTTAEAVFPLATTLFRDTTAAQPLRVAIKNNDASLDIYVGPSTVTNAGVNGFKLKAGESISYDCFHTNDLADMYAVAASGTPSISVLVIGPNRP